MINRINNNHRVTENTEGSAGSFAPGWIRSDRFSKRTNVSVIGLGLIQRDFVATADPNRNNDKLINNETREKRELGEKVLTGMDPPRRVFATLRQKR
jgi:hypothetical protein